MDKFEQLAKRIAKDVLIKWHIPLNNNKRNNFLQFFKFCLVGISNTLISYFAYLFLVIIGTHYILASIIGFFVSVIISFFWNNKYVFTKKSGESRESVITFYKTLISYTGTGIFISNILLFLWVSVVHIPKEVAPLLNLCATVPMNFLKLNFGFIRQKNEILNFGTLIYFCDYNGTLMVKKYYLLLIRMACDIII